MNNGIDGIDEQGNITWQRDIVFSSVTAASNQADFLIRLEDCAGQLMTVFNKGKSPVFYYVPATSLLGFDPLDSNLERELQSYGFEDGQVQAARLLTNTAFDGGITFQRKPWA